MRTMALPQLLRGLVLQCGWSITAAGHAAGISPVAADRWCSQVTDAAATWLRLMSAFRAEVRIAQGQEIWAIQVPTLAQQVRERDRRSWRHRRFLHYIHAIAAQNRTLKRVERETRARGYVANEEARIVAGIEEVRRRMGTVLIAGEVDGMRAVVQALVRASHITTDELSFAAGVGMDATALSVTATDDGRLRPLRCLLAALDARLEVHLPSDNRVVIARIAHAPEASPQIATAPPIAASSSRGTSPSPNASTVRSRIERDEILGLYDAGIPITQIAEQAGISRQRVHAIAKSSGRLLRRITATQARTREAASILS